MKKLIAIACMIQSLLVAQKPEKIYPFARHDYPADYLKIQSELWKKEVAKDRTDANAWYNYYYANRNLIFADTTRTRKEKNEVIEKLVADMGLAIPESYEYNLARWLSGGWNMELLSYLKKAQQLGPDRPEHLDFSIVLSEIKGDKNDRDKWSRKKYEAGQFSIGLVYYNYNVLAGLPQNAILITSGDNDTYPIWYLQSLGIRPDVEIVHTQMINLKEYRDAVLGRLQVPSWTGSVVPWHTFSPQEHKNNMVSWLAEKSNRPLCVGLTSQHCAKSAPSANLYLTGLAYSYSAAPMDNLALLKRNFGQLYALDYLERSFFPDISEDLVKIVNGNYIVPMLKLFEHYRASGEEQEAARMKRIILVIAKDTPSESEVKKKLAVL